MNVTELVAPMTWTHDILLNTTFFRKKFVRTIYIYEIQNLWQLVPTYQLNSQTFLFVPSHKWL